MTKTGNEDSKLPACFAVKNMAYECDEAAHIQLSEYVEPLMQIFGSHQNLNGMNEQLLLFIRYLSQNSVTF